MYLDSTTNSQNGQGAFWTYVGEWWATEQEDARRDTVSLCGMLIAESRSEASTGSKNSFVDYVVANSCIPTLSYQIKAGSTQLVG